MPSLCGHLVGKAHADILYVIMYVLKISGREESGLSPAGTHSSHFCLLVYQVDTQMLYISSGSKESLYDIVVRKFVQNARILK